LTTGLQLAKNDRQQGARQPGDIISYRRATSSRNQRATSSESADMCDHRDDRIARRDTEGKAIETGIFL
jgi:hypothetical protein